MALMKSSPCTLSLLILSTSPLFGLGTVVSRYFTQMGYHYTHQEARNYCQSSHSDMAQVLTQADSVMVNLASYSAWVGLTRTDVQEWLWNNRLPVDGTKWASGHPIDTHQCAFIHYPSREFYSSTCDASLFFYCSVGGQFVFVPESRTWPEAQRHCNTLDTVNGDLASLSSLLDLYRVDFHDYPMWILQDPTGLGSDGECVTMTTQLKLVEVTNCSHRFPFMCSNDNVFLVKEEKSWEEAVEHCRALGLSPSQDGTLSSYQLLSVQAQDQDFLSTKTSEALSDEVWVGLRFLGGTWFWTNGVPMDDPELPVCPPPGKHCGVLSKQAVGVLTADCAEKKNFLCYKL